MTDLLLPLGGDVDPTDGHAEGTPAGCCRACHRPVSSAEARRTGYGSHCRRKGRPRRGPRPVLRGGRFVVDQEPLPVVPAETT